METAVAIGKTGKKSAESGTASYEHDDQEYLKRTLFTLRNYQNDTINNLSYKQRYLAEFSSEQKQLLMESGFGTYLENIMSCVDANQLLLNVIYDLAEETILDGEPFIPEQGRKVYRADYLRLKELLAQVVREWTSAGQRERDESFKVMLGQLEELYPSSTSGGGGSPRRRENVRVLVPGSGLGRLPYEGACLGFDVRANEQSLFMLLTTNFIIGKCSRADNYRFYPHIHDLNNRLAGQDITTPISFPDVNPRLKIEEIQLDFIQGDFLETCTPEALVEWHPDCVMTSFFLDSAKNVLDYVELIARLLPDGGHWINLGPLNYVFNRITEEIRLELSWEHLRMFIEESGFVFVKEAFDLDCGYCYDPNAMGNSRFKCLNFVCKKTSA